MHLRPRRAARWPLRGPRTCNVRKRKNPAAAAAAAVFMNGRDDENAWRRFRGRRRRRCCLHVKRTGAARLGTWGRGRGLRAGGSATGFRSGANVCGLNDDARVSVGGSTRRGGWPSGHGGGGNPYIVAREAVAAAAPWMKSAERRLVRNVYAHAARHTSGRPGQSVFAATADARSFLTYIIIIILILLLLLLLSSLLPSSPHCYGVRQRPGLWGGGRAGVWRLLGSQISKHPPRTKIWGGVGETSVELNADRPKKTMSFSIRISIGITDGTVNRKTFETEKLFSDFVGRRKPAKNPIENIAFYKLSNNVNKNWIKKKYIKKILSRFYISGVVHVSFASPPLRLVVLCVPESPHSTRPPTTSPHPPDKFPYRHS